MFYVVVCCLEFDGRWLLRVFCAMCVVCVLFYVVFCVLFVFVFSIVVCLLCVG